MKRERDNACSRAAAADRDAAALRQRFEEESAALAAEGTARLAAARAAAEERVERHTDKYRAQVPCAYFGLRCGCPIADLLFPLQNAMRVHRAEEDRMLPLRQ